MTPNLSPRPALPDSVRVMVVDDSAVIRGLIARVLEGEPDIEVAVTVSDGRQAVAALARHPVDVIVLDIEMPQMDGLTAIPLLLAQFRRSEHGTWVLCGFGKFPAHFPASQGNDGSAEMPARHAKPR